MLTTTEPFELSERRDSVRWNTEKVLWWRPRQGRRSHCSKVVERSLTSLVFIAPLPDAPGVGSLLHPSDPLMGERHGFRIGIVRRLRDIPGGQLVYVEILA